MTLPKAIICDLPHPGCEDKESVHYFFFHMTQQEWEYLNQPFYQKVPKYKFNLIRKIKENDPMPGNTVWIGERPRE